jgi:hypothetical protein
MVAISIALTIIITVIMLKVDVSKYLDLIEKKLKNKKAN